MATLVLAEHDLGTLAPATARLVAAAAQLGASVDLLVAGEGVDEVAIEAARLEGVARVRVAQSPALATLSPEALTALLETLAPGYDAIVAGSTATGRDAIPRLAARLDLMPVTDVVVIRAPQKFDRPIYAGNAIETVVSAQPKQLLTVRASAFRPVGQGGSAAIEPVTAGGVAAVARFVAAHRTKGDTPDLATAQIVVGGGIAVRSEEGFKLIEGLAARLGAAVGATRAAVDAGYAPNDWQVGQTGKIIAPDLYIAIGISGALQHLAGIQGAKKIIAINTDAEAPLMKLADVALVGDLFVVIPALIAELDRLGVKH
ncbi:MAG TPA: electron transfer flavoprotein subunit alpha/FixB family protein [Devosiaceae bacterium]|jgi:electron transfer flavoprotein alpha subunit